MGPTRDVDSLQEHEAHGHNQMQRPVSSTVRIRPLLSDDVQLRRPAAVETLMQPPPNYNLQMRPPASVNTQLRQPVALDALMRPPPNGDVLMRPSQSVASFMQPPSTTAQTRLQSVGGHILQASRFGDTVDPQHMVVYENSFPDASFEDMSNTDMFVNGSMAASENYYTNMLSEGTHLVDFEDLRTPCNEQPSQKVQETPPVSSARPNHKRSKNFSEKEDEILVSAWLNVSLDPIIGANQTHKSYWTRIYDYFHENLPFPSDRTQNSLMHHWSTIQDSVNKFTGCLTRIEGRRQSGATMQDKIEDARALFKSEDGQNKSFQFTNCWKKLRGQAKWIAKLDELTAAKSSTKKQKKTSNSSLATPPVTTIEGREIAAPEENTLSRPMGHKKAKTTLHQGGKKSCTESLEHIWEKKKEFDSDKELKKDQRFKQAFALEQERVANEKLNLELRKELELRAREVELKNKKEEERIMTMDLSALPDDQKEYYMCCRSKIMGHHPSA